MLKRIALITRKPGMSREAFLEHWNEVHGPLVSEHPNVLRYVQDNVPLTMVRGNGNVPPRGAPIRRRYARSGGGIWGGHEWRSLGGRRGDERLLVNAIAPSTLDTPGNRQAMPKADPAK